ncbi:MULTISPECIES: hypothetical protein [Vibrio]|uniref:hypothetical protein n=1 Tax=Vibrio TaxID=662 RepID=UPI00159EDB74|nr:MULTISPECIES: hypothetical protein [Vibrio]
MSEDNPIESKIVNRSDSVKSAVQCLVSHDKPIDMDGLSSLINMTENQKTVVRRALMEISRKDTRVKFIPARQAQFFYTEFDCPLRSKIALAMRLLEIELNDIVYQHNSQEFQEICVKIEKMLNDVLNLRS